MGVSNHKPRIVLQFNEFDFRHRKVLEVLRARPRNMTDMVVNAILHFINCPDAEQEFSRETIRKIVQEVITEMQSEGTLISLTSAAAKPQDSADDADLGDMMSAFRE